MSVKLEDCLKSFEEHHVAETDDLKAEIERLRAALNSLVKRTRHGWTVVAKKHKKYFLDRERSILVDTAFGAVDSPPSEEEE